MNCLNVFNNVILTRNRQLPDDDRMIETHQAVNVFNNIILARNRQLPDDRMIGTHQAVNDLIM